LEALLRAADCRTSLRATQCAQMEQRVAL
jgi:hypothetical protein